MELPNLFYWIEGKNAPLHCVIKNHWLTIGKINSVKSFIMSVGTEFKTCHLTIWHCRNILLQASKEKSTQRQLYVPIIMKKSLTAVTEFFDNEFDNEDIRQKVQNWATTADTAMSMILIEMMLSFLAMRSSGKRCSNFLLKWSHIEKRMRRKTKTNKIIRWWKKSFFFQDIIQSIMKHFLRNWWNYKKSIRKH